jgi:hypothetical protein
MDAAIDFLEAVQETTGVDPRDSDWVGELLAHGLLDRADEGYWAWAKECLEWPNDLPEHIASYLTQSQAKRIKEAVKQHEERVREAEKQVEAYRVSRENAANRVMELQAELEKLRAAQDKG